MSMDYFVGSKLLGNHSNIRKALSWQYVFKVYEMGLLLNCPYSSKFLTLTLYTYRAF